MCAIFFFLLLFIVWTLYVYTLYQTFFCVNIYSTLKKYLSVVSSYCFCFFFVLLLLHLSVCFVSLWLISHPTVALCVCVCVCVAVYVCIACHRVQHFATTITLLHQLRKIPEKLVER